MQPTNGGDTSVLAALFRHNTWATLKMLDFCATLSDEQLDASAPGTFGSIRATLRHIVGAEASYVGRVTGRRPAKPLGPGFPDFATLKEVARWTGDELLDLALSARAYSVVEERDPDVKAVARYPLASLMLQAINHATEHRTHVSTILTVLGLEPPDTSGWAYMVETGEFQETREDGA